MKSTMIEIPEQLRQPEFRFVLVRPGEKKAFESSWQRTANYSYDDEELLAHLREEGNYGVLCGKGDLIVIDADHPSFAEHIRASLPATFTVRSGSGKGLHFYYLCRDLRQKIILQVGRNDHFGEVQSTGTYVVGPNCVHPSGGVYEVARDVPIATVPKADVLKVCEPFKEKDRELKDRPHKGEFDIGVPILQVIDVSILKRLSRAGEYQGAHPVHGSGTGMNFCVNVDKNVWHCFRCNSGGGVLSWVGVREEIIPCHQARPGGLSRETFQRIEQVAREKYGLIIPERPNASKYFTEDDHFVPEWLAQDVLSRVSVITMRDNREMYYYNGRTGLWDPSGHVEVEEIASNLLGEASRRNLVEETVYHIRTRTYQDRSIFDMPLNLIPLRNGILDLEMLELLPYSREHFFTFKIPGEYAADARCPLISKFLSEIVAPADVNLLKEVMAYCLYRAYPIQKAVMLVGEGSNGKSVFLGLLKNFLGSENVTSNALQDLEYSRFSLANLYHKLANIYPDISTSGLSSTGRFKMITGGDMITAERKFGQPFNFVNYAKLLFSCNQMPIADDETSAYYRRWIIVNFPNTFDEASSDKGLMGKLAAPDELSGLLNELIPILQALLAQGKFDYAFTPAEVKEQYIRMSDSVGAFNMDQLIADPDGFVPKEELYNAYAEYCRRRNILVVDKAAFTKRLAKYVEVISYRPEIKGARVQCLKGVRLVRVDSKEDEKEAKRPAQPEKATPAPALTYSKQNPIPSGMSTPRHYLSEPEKRIIQKTKWEVYLGGDKEYGNPDTPDTPDGTNYAAYERLLLQLCQQERTYIELLDRFEAPDVAEQAITHLLHKGLLFEPRPGIVLRVGGSVDPSDAAPASPNS